MILKQNLHNFTTGQHFKLTNHSFIMHHCKKSWTEFTNW